MLTGSHLPYMRRQDAPPARLQPPTIAPWEMQPSSEALLPLLWLINIAVVGGGWWLGPEAVEWGLHKQQRARPVSEDGHHLVTTTRGGRAGRHTHTGVNACMGACFIVVHGTHDLRITLAATMSRRHLDGLTHTATHGSPPPSVPTSHDGPSDTRRASRRDAWRPSTSGRPWLRATDRNATCVVEGARSRACSSRCRPCVCARIAGRIAAQHHAASRAAQAHIGRN